MHRRTARLRPIDRHRISAFESEIEHGQNQEPKNHAEQTLPTIEDYIRIAESSLWSCNSSRRQASLS